uniref:Uncharacterized protein n=1 Tax=Opuntia streptacantha TaxID=393608 RepID=A0A7C9AXR7_OPUST
MPGLRSLIYMKIFREDLGSYLVITTQGEQWKASESSKGKCKRVPFARMHYFPLIPRLQRLYASHSSAPHMRWHHEYRREDGVLCHPSDGDAWKQFDQLHHDFASEP